MLEILEYLRDKVALGILPKARDGTKINPFSVISTRPADIPIYTKMTVRKATREGYKTSIYVFRAVRTIVQAASAIPWVILDKNGEHIENHPLAKVLARPNPEFSGQDMIELMIAHLELVGNALWMPIIVGNQVKEIWPVMPDLVSPIPSDQPGEWLKGWQVLGQNGVEITLPPEQFLHFMQMDPGDLYWGTSPLIAAARTIDTDNEAQDFQKISMQNRATPDGAFTFEAPLTLEQLEEARRQMRENFLQKSRSREPWVLGAGAKWEQMSLSPKELDFVASRLQNKRDIAGAFGISPIFLGDLEQSSYDNMVQARKALYEDVVIPLLDDAKSTLNLKIAPLYGDIIISYDTSKVAALREDYTKKVEQAKNLWGMGVPFDQINARLEMGFDEFPGWDNGYLPMMIQPTGSAPSVPGKMIEKSLDLQTDEQKTAHWKRVDQRRVGWWGVISKKFLPLYEAEGRAIDKAIKGKAPSKLVDISKDIIQGLSADWERLMVATLTTIIDDFGSLIADDLGAGKSDNGSEFKWEFDPTTSFIRQWIISEGAKDISLMLATNLEDIKRVILAGMDESLSTPQIAKNIRQYYIDKSPYKAMRAARTEVTKASGFGNLEAAKQSGVAKKKTWLTSRDERVRKAHITMDGESIGLDETFSNGVDFPSEPMCRCVLTFHSER